MRTLHFAILALSSLSACGNSGNGATISTELALGGTSRTQLLHARSVAGGSGAAGLKSMKYFIRSIQICRELTPNGSGFSSTKGCLNLYDAPGDDRYTYDA